MKLSKPPANRLRQNYLLNFETALILSLTIFIGLFKLNLSDNSDSISFNMTGKEILHLEGIISTTHAPRKPEPPPDISVPNPPPRDNIIQEHLRNIDIEFSLPDPIPLPSKTQNLLPKKDYESSYSIPMLKLPKLIGGIEKLQRNIEYPALAIKDKVEGRVIVEFLVDKNGNVRNPKILKGVREDINHEALRAISNARFIPARERGKAIPVEQVIFIVFKLDNNS